MRVDPHTVDSIVHVVKRGARGMDIVRDYKDRQRFIESVFTLNDVFVDENWKRDIARLGPFERPVHWPEREPLVRILLWTLLPNHFHLLLQEVREGGIAKFMQKLCGSMSLSFNIKYCDQGNIFQGSYKGRLVDKDNYLRYLVFYISVKNVLELYPGGLVNATKDFDRAWDWAIKYPFSSLPNYINSVESPILDDSQGIITEIFGRKDQFKKEAHEMLLTYLSSRPDEFEKIMLESWQ
mgnify:CR=1 FL=1